MQGLNQVLSKRNEEIDEWKNKYIEVNSIVI